MAFGLNFLMLLLFTVVLKVERTWIWLLKFVVDIEICLFCVLLVLLLRMDIEVFLRLAQLYEQQLPVDAFSACGFCVRGGALIPVSRIHHCVDLYV